MIVARFIKPGVCTVGVVGKWLQVILYLLLHRVKLYVHSIARLDLYFCL